MAKRQMRETETMEDVMKLTSEDIMEPSLVPAGPWVIRCLGLTTRDGVDQDGNEQRVINLRYEAFEPDPEVDPDEVEKGGFEGRVIWVKRYLSKPAARAQRDGTLARFINFVEMSGVDTTGRDLEDMCKAMKGSTIRADVGSYSYTNRDGDLITDNNAKNFAPAS